MLTHVLIQNSLPQVSFWNGHREGINISKKNRQRPKLNCPVRDIITGRAVLALDISKGRFYFFTWNASIFGYTADSPSISSMRRS